MISYLVKIFMSLFNSILLRLLLPLSFQNREINHPIWLCQSCCLFFVSKNSTLSAVPYHVYKQGHTAAGARRGAARRGVSLSVLAHQKDAPFRPHYCHLLSPPPLSSIFSVIFLKYFLFFRSLHLLILLFLLFQFVQSSYPFSLLPTLSLLSFLVFLHIFSSPSHLFFYSSFPCPLLPLPI
jgi:hypothetical protein